MKMRSAYFAHKQSSNQFACKKKHLRVRKCQFVMQKGISTMQSHNCASVFLCIFNRSPKVTI